MFKNIWIKILFALICFLILLPFSTVSGFAKESKNVKATEYIKNQKLPDKISTVNGIPLVNKQNPVPKGYSGHPTLKAEADKNLATMIADAKKKKINISSFSGFRSIENQKKLYDSYVKKNGKEKADRFSARPQYSEHHLALAFDMKDNSIKDDVFSEKAEKSAGIKWLHENMHKYGFILRYPKKSESKTGYTDEFWHIRYIGKKHAEAMKKEKITILEEYLGVTEGEVVKGSIEKKDAKSFANKEGSGKEEGKDKTESSNKEGESSGGDYEWFNPFENPEISESLNTGVDKNNLILPSELSYVMIQTTYWIAKICYFIIVVVNLAFIVYISLQITYVALLNRGNVGGASKMESLLFGDKFLAKDYWKIIFKNIAILLLMMTLTMTMLFAEIQAKIYTGISVILSWIF